MNQHLLRLFASAALTALAGLTFAADEADGIGSFEITQFHVEGNSLLDPSTVERLLAPYTGQRRDFGHVQRALEALEAAYRARGYKVVQVVLPEQELSQGVVRLQVVETRLGKVRVEGNKHFDEVNVRASLAGLREGRTPNLDQVSASLKLANQNPAKQTALRLMAGERDDQVDAVVKVVDEKPWRIGASVDNSGNRVTGKTLVTTQFQHANVGGRDHVLSLQYTTSVENPEQISVYGAGYHIPLYGRGDSIDVYATHSDVESSTVLAGILNLHVSGRGTVWGGRYNQILPRAGDYESMLMYGFDHKAYRTSINNLAVGDVTVRPVSLTYAGTWSDARSSMGYGVTLLRNIAGGSQGNRADFSAARTRADPAYIALRLNAAYSRALSSDWQARVAFAAQLSPDVLVPGEQFGAGGQATVRGFSERDITGDSGHVVNAEIYTPNLCKTVKQATVQCRALAFADAGRVSRHNFQPGDPYENASIASVGLGWRMNVEKNMALQLDYGHVVDSGVTRSEGKNRVHVKLAVSY